MQNSSFLLTVDVVAIPTPGNTYVCFHKTHQFSAVCGSILSLGLFCLWDYFCDVYDPQSRYRQELPRVAPTGAYLGENTVKHSEKQ